MDMVELIPWDPTSDQHITRLYGQRIACGWHENKILQWREDQGNGSRAMYWIVFADDFPGCEALLARHVAAYPEASEHEPLIDTSSEIYRMPRVATGRAFVPVGHLSLTSVDPGDARGLSLPLSSAWLQKLYVSWAIQRSGVGRAALAAAEHTASLPPLNATVVVLDTLRGEVQRSEAFLKKAYDNRGMLRPVGYKSNQEWYAGRGYEVMDGPEYSKFVDPTTREVETVPIVYMRKDLR